MCLDDQILNTYLDGELAEPWKSQVEEHLSYCNACRERCEKIRCLTRTIQEAVISDEEIARRQENVLKMIENTCFNRKKVPFFQKQFRINLPAFASIAAAFVFIFVGSILYINKESSTFIPALVDNTIDENKINLVTDTTKQKSIDDYSLEEIITSLDKRGYSVDLKLKGVEPVKFE